MPGLPPKPSEQRRRRNAPARGEWVDLEPLEQPILGSLLAKPRNAKWSGRVVDAWEAWRNDPVTACYGPADIAAVRELAYLMDDWVKGKARRDAGALVYRRMNELGLTPAGKRSLRWRLPNDPQRRAEGTQEAKPRLAAVRRLRAVDIGRPAGGDGARITGSDR